MSGAVTAIATTVSAFAANAAAFAGASSAVIEGVSTFAYTAATIGVTTGISAGIGALFAPKVPDPTALQTPLKQPMAVRQSAFGRVRVAGCYAFFGTGTGTAKALSIDILALLDGRSKAIVYNYLNDDQMAYYGNGYWWAPGAQGKYGGGGSNPPNLVSISGRLGAATETSYSEIAGALPLWDANHRGDGVTSMAVYCKPARREDQAGDYPNGCPVPSAVIDSQYVYDPRDGTQTQGTASTYKFSDNPILALLAYLTDASGGMGLDYARFILPSVSLWTAAADECDGVVSTSGMHATLLDAAAVGDTKIFLADTTGLAAGVVIALPTENVTVSALGLAGEVDITGTLTYAHTAGELAYWNAAGQSARYRCAGTYRHDTPPGDVVKSILATFDGWIGQRGDGALVPRTNTLYAPAVTLGDSHIVGYRIDNYLPDEQATNQLIVSYTDPAGGFNKAEAGYVQDDIDIAQRGQLRSQELYLQWCPSGPQAIGVARAMLARATQPLRMTFTTNLAGLAVMGERFIRIQSQDLPALNDLIVEVTGKVSIDLANLQVSFPCVAVAYRSNGAAQALCFMLDITRPAPTAPAGIVANLKAGVQEALTLIGATYGAGLDLCIVAQGDATASITRRAASAADISDLITWVGALAEAVTYSFDGVAAMTACKTFFDGTDAGITSRRLIWAWDGVPDVTGNDPPSWPGHAAAIAAVAAGMPDVKINVINIETPDATWALYFDNTPDDGVPFAADPAQLAADIEQAVFGSSSTPGSGYTLPPLAPPSGAPLQPLSAPTIISVTPEYLDSGGGVSGARLAIEVNDPGLGTVTWKVQWKLSADTLWTQAPGPLDAAGSPLTLLTDFVPAAGAIDVQVAYVLASQVSPWSATTTATAAAPDAARSLTAAVAIAAGKFVNIFSSGGAAEVQLADSADDTKPADGFVLTGVSIGGTAAVYGLGQKNTALSGLTPGAPYYLGTAGAATATVPTAAGAYQQILGKADSATALTFTPQATGMGIG